MTREPTAQANVLNQHDFGAYILSQCSAGTRITWEQDLIHQISTSKYKVINFILRGVDAGKDILLPRYACPESWHELDLI